MIKTESTKKQREIRKGVAKHFRPHTLGEADELIAYLHSQGVVIRVEKELPKRTWYEDWGGKSGEDGYKLALEDMVGYVAVEPLTERDVVVLCRERCNRTTKTSG